VQQQQTTQQQQQIQQHQHKAHQVQKEKKVHNKGPQQTQGGYCEICEAPFSELEGHIVSKVHIARVGLSHLWSKLDTCIDQINKTGTSEDDLDNSVQDLDQSVM
jgi:hypothetical protein